MVQCPLVCIKNRDSNSVAVANGTSQVLQFCLLAVMYISQSHFSAVMCISLSRFFSQVPAHFFFINYV